LQAIANPKEIVGKSDANPVDLVAQAIANPTYANPMQHPVLLCGFPTPLCVLFGFTPVCVIYQIHRKSEAHAIQAHPSESDAKPIILQKLRKPQLNPMNTLIQICKS